MERANIGGVELEYETAGSGEPVVCIHGALIADTFRPLLSQPGLTNTYQLVSYHRRGYAGSSPVASPSSIAQQAADCLGLLRHLGIDRTHIAGHSFGGDIAIQLAIDAPEAVHSLALLEPALFVGTSAPHYRAGLARASERFREAGSFTAVDEFLTARWPAYRDPLDRILPGAFDQGVANAGTFFEHEIPELLAWCFGEAEAKLTTQPVLSLLGEENVAPNSRFAEVHRLLLEWLPGAEGAVLPGASHFLQVQNPADAAAILSGFWSRHPIPVL